MLLQCPECEKSVSDKARVCPTCGINFDNNENEIKIEDSISFSERHPVIFRMIIAAALVFFVRLFFYYEYFYIITKAANEMAGKDTTIFVLADKFGALEEMMKTSKSNIFEGYILLFILMYPIAYIISKIVKK